ncbi:MULTISPECIES: PIN domain-containing protein [Streptomyces]|uniref:Ribonuclease VapC n=1 Tax=Streptomyces olivaceus TaxID=47716 RepID=A0ABS7W3A9_STROV|nr:MULTISPECIES: PIN domain-containing protein [Streptomyces]MBZ6084872.1 PIN domain-containing protein [Streptomyces olivaceus]MBZ6088781.1 PIN domain-containing protein [Streptomyces olivaceus]MBZ6095845.1 PIN domain-containing protein [Streptomyces olivaceus]MBZ6111568.1 PIN domain-containing protein [Streptomyces olivaceus]MBZ6116921.1 PIN domain-containing protein [Streptomyces olivaceus]
MMYLLDTSGLVRLLRDANLQSAWHDAIDAGAIASCYVQRTEFLYSARNRSEYDEIAEMFSDLYPDAAVPKNAGRWISAVQHRMAQAGEHRSASAVDLVIAATAAHHGLTVLHDDADYGTVARHASDLNEYNVNDVV